LTVPRPYAHLLVKLNVNLAACENPRMSYRAADARAQVLDQVASAAEHLGVAVARLGEAYERMDEHSADQLEEQLFRPLQGAYGAAQRTHSGFASRYGLPTRKFEQASPGLPAGPREEIERAADEIRTADATLAALQDSMLPVDVGDPELRAGLAQTRGLIGPLPGRARELVRILGR
jgi:hypothetical protein